MTKYLGIMPVAIDGDADSIDDSAKHRVGIRAFDKDGNEYMYGKGVASCVAGSWVSLDEDVKATLAVANGKGRIAVAMGAIVVNKYGWFQIYGKNTIAKALVGFADNAIIFLTSTAGSVDDTDVAGDLVSGAIGRSAVADGVITVELSYPYVDDTADN